MGQHFLTSEKALQAIVKAADLHPNDIVLEVGPGKGVLTKKLVEQVKKVIAIEKDARFVKLLKSQFQDAANLEIREGDILRDDDIFEKDYKLVANIPYYLTSNLIKKFLHGKGTMATLLIQKEVAERIVAQPPHMSVLALSVQAFAKARTRGKVSRNSFRPAPQVDSAIIVLEKKEKSFFEEYNISEEIFFSLIKKAFAGKRKKLRNTIGINSDRRPQELSLDDWAEIIRNRK